MASLCKRMGCDSGVLGGVGHGRENKATKQLPNTCSPDAVEELPYPRRPQRASRLSKAPKQLPKSCAKVAPASEFKPSWAKCQPSLANAGQCWPKFDQNWLVRARDWQICLNRPTSVELGQLLTYCGLYSANFDRTWPSCAIIFQNLGRIGPT